MKIPSFVPELIMNVLLVTVAFLGGFYFTSMFHKPTSLIGGMWAAISAIIVIEATHKETLSSAMHRVLGTLVGSVVSGTYLILFQFSLFGFAATVGVGMLICYLFHIEKAIKLTTITIAVVLIVATVDNDLHPYINAGLRLTESAIGSGLAVLIGFLFYILIKKKIHKKNKTE